MSLVPAVCPNCSGAIKVDDTGKAGLCPFCKTPFVVDDAIKNYNTFVSNTTNIAHADQVIVNDDKSVEQRLASAESFLTTHHDLKRAGEIYADVVKDRASDYRGWWGLVRSQTDELSNYFAYNNYVQNNADGAIRCMPPDVKADLQPKWESYRQESMRQKQERQAREQAEKQALLAEKEQYEKQSKAADERASVLYAEERKHQDTIRELEREKIKCEEAVRESMSKAGPGCFTWILLAIVGYFIVCLIIGISNGDTPPLLMLLIPAACIAGAILSVIPGKARVTSKKAELKKVEDDIAKHKQECARLHEQACKKTEERNDFWNKRSEVISKLSKQFNYRL